MVAPPLKRHTLSTVLFHKDVRANISVTNCMSHFSMFVPTKATAKLANLNTRHAQGIGIISCRFINCFIIYPMGKVYISLGALKFYVVFKKGTSEPLEHCDFVYPQGCSRILT